MTTASPMKNIHLHRHLPTMSTNDREEHQRRATAFLSSWINRNSFRIDSSSGSSKISDDENMIDDSSSCISGVSLPPDFLEDLSISDDYREVYEEDDEFNTSISNAHQHNSPHFSSSIHSRSLHAPSSSPTRHSNDSSNKYQRGGGNHRRSNSASDYLPNNKSEVQQQKQQQIASRLSWQDHRGVTGKYTGQINDRMQPHGSGALIYKDGSSKTSIWKNGVPVQSWSPEVGSKKQQQRQPLLPTNNHTSSSSASSDHTYLPHLDLGDVGTSQDMIIESSSRSIALEKLNSLKIHDFTFILRSDGQWTYAIIADRQDNTIRFVVNTDGDAKTLSEKHWSTSIRLVNPDGAFCNSGTRSNVSNQSKKNTCNRKTVVSRRRSRRSKDQHELESIRASTSTLKGDALKTIIESLV
mmetsp:Transcript_35937/g.63047  ORF Transcript_35937/g.63047 Transcript_35937/m.63047 type:complete len:411 (+) Transcript_35937:43-1275(+)